MRWSAAGWLAALVACSGEPSPADAGADAAVDASPDEDAATSIDPPTPPALPEPPHLSPCPAGWRAIGEGDEAACDPWPEGGRPDCPADQVIFPGEPGCGPIGVNCPDGDALWQQDLPDDGSVLFVRAPDGDPVLGGAGTRLDPFETIAEALVAAAPSATVALSRGTFHEVLPLSQAVVLQGACVGGTVLDPPLPAGGGTVQVLAAGVVVRDLEVRGEGIWIRAAGTAELQSVLVSDADPFGVVVDAGVLTGARLVVRDTHGDGFGLGLHVQVGRADLQQVVLERNQTMGLSIAGAELVTITDLAVEDTREGTQGELGVGLAIGQGATGEFERVVFERNRAAGAFVQDHATIARITDGVFRDTQGQAYDGDGGYGLSVFTSARAELERVLIERNRTGGIGIAYGAAVVLRDAIIRDGLSRELDGAGGLGIGVTTASDLDAERVALIRNRGLGVTVGNEASTARLRDLIVRDTDGQESDDDGGYGLSFGEPASVVLERGLFERNQTAGIYGFQEGTLQASDVTVRDTRTHPSGILGRGLTVQDAVVAELDRAVFVGNLEASVLAAGLDTHLTMRDVVVEDTLERACADDPDGCPTTGAGAGIVSVLSADIDVRRFVARRNAICGVQLARDGSISLHEGEVSDNPIGANVQVEGFDFALLQDRVLFHDNGRNLDSSVLAVPDPNFSR